MSGDLRDLPRQLRLLVGQVVAGRYVVDDFVGMGGMAVVFRGRHATLNRSVAIKVLRPEYAESPEIAARFDREARAASNFDHPNCIQVFDTARTSTGLKFMVMPLLQGTELARVLGEPLPQSQCIACGLQVLRGLEHAHRLGVVHRDLKPDNVFVTRDRDGREVLKIVDFGIAKILDDASFDDAGFDAVFTKVGAVVGTPAYMSPEQAMGGEIDRRTDLYSLGVMLFHMLTGAPPFIAADPRGLLFQHVSMEPPPLPESIDPLVNEAVSTLMAKQPEHRYQSAVAAIVSLERVAKHLATDPTPWVSLLDPARRRAKRTSLVDQDEERVHTDHYGDPEAPAAKAQARAVAAETGREVDLDRMDNALKRLLDGNTATAEDNLRSGIYHPPTPGYEFDTLDEDPKEE